MIEIKNAVRRHIQRDPPRSARSVDALANWLREELRSPCSDLRQRGHADVHVVPQAAASLWPPPRPALPQTGCLQWQVSFTASLLAFPQKKA